MAAPTTKNLDPIFAITVSHSDRPGEICYAIGNLGLVQIYRQTSPPVKSRFDDARSSAVFYAERRPSAGDALRRQSEKEASLRASQTQVTFYRSCQLDGIAQWHALIYWNNKFILSFIQATDNKRPNESLSSCGNTCRLKSKGTRRTAQALPSPTLALWTT